jgi:hypothetical protein
MKQRINLKRSHPKSIGTSSSGESSSEEDKSEEKKKPEIKQATHHIEPDSKRLKK